MNTNQKEVVALMHQYALINKGCTIHSSIQIKSFGNNVNDKSLKLRGGKQRIKTVDGYSIPLSIKAGLPVHEDAETHTQRHGHITSCDPDVQQRMGSNYA